MSAQANVSNSSAGYQSSSGATSGLDHSNANPSHAPASVRIRPHSQPARPSEQATGRGGITREAPGRASADCSSRSSSSDGSGVHTLATVGAR